MGVQKGFVFIGLVVGLACCHDGLGQVPPRIITGNGADSSLVKRFSLSGVPDAAFFAYSPTFAGACG
jgi:hypothetical protein